MFAAAADDESPPVGRDTDAVDAAVVDPALAVVVTVALRPVPVPVAATPLQYKELSARATAAAFG